MIRRGFCLPWLALCLLSPLPLLLAGGKHLEVMAPLSQQSDLKGKPHRVIERSFEAKEGERAKLESVKESEYDKDGNPLRIDSFDGNNRKTDFEVYGYDASGTWISLVEMSDGKETVYQIYVDAKTKRVAKVDGKAKQTEFISYTDRGFEAGTVTQTSAGRIVEKTAFTRNSNDKEERVIFEEPAGTKTTEFLVQWTAQGFQATSTMIFHDKGGDKIVSTFEYPEIDASGNWLTQVEKRALHLRSGEIRPLATVTVTRTITYHP